MERQRQIEIWRQIDEETEPDREMERQRQTERWRDRDRQRDGETEPDREMERQRDEETETDREMKRQRQTALAQADRFTTKCTIQLTNCIGSSQIWFKKRTFMMFCCLMIQCHAILIQLSHLVLFFTFLLSFFILVSFQQFHLNPAF